MFITRKILQLNLRTGRIWPTKNNVRNTQFRSHPSSAILSSGHTLRPVYGPVYQYAWRHVTQSLHTFTVSCSFVPCLWVTTPPYLKTCQKNVLPLPYSLKTVVAESSKTLIIIYHTTRCHIPEKSFSHSQQEPQISHDTLCDSCLQFTSNLSKLTHCGRVRQICVFNAVNLGTSASSP